MHRIVSKAAILSCLFLGACSPQAQIDGLAQSASGTVSELKQKVNAVVQPAVDTVNEIDKKIKKFQSGAEMIQKGISEVNGAL